MNDKWINDLEQKMKDHTEIAPEGLWEDLEQKLFKEEKGKIIPLWSDTVDEATEIPSTPKQTNYKRILSIAASIIILLVGGIEIYLRNPNSLEPINKTPDVKEKESIVVEPNAVSTPLESDKQTVQEEGERIVEKVKKDTQSLVLQEVVDDQSMLERQENTTGLINEKQKEELEKRAVVEAQTNLIDKVQIQDKLQELTEEKSANIEKSLVQTDIDQEEFKPRKKRGFSLGLLSGNMSSNSSMQQTGYSAMGGTSRLEATVQSGYGMASAVLSEIYVANQNKDVYTDVQHKKPIRFGVALYYSLGEKWGVNTGVTYTKLTSDLTSGSNEYKIINTQTLHYVGIPIQVNYNVWGKGNFSTYVNGGFNFEKSVYGTLKTKYQAGDKVEKIPDEKVNVKGIQTSVNMSIGMEYKLGKGIGVFFEPGVRYHFDNGSSFQTIYTEKPFNFNAQIGLRYSIPNGNDKKPRPSN